MVGIQHQEKQKKIKKIKSNINEIVKGRDKFEEPKSAMKNFKHFTNDDKKLSICLTIILKLYMKLNTKQNMENESKSYLLSKCFKDCQQNLHK